MVVFFVYTFCCFIIFSGDIGQSEKPLTRPPTAFDRADFVVMESTYGDREHQERPFGPVGHPDRHPVAGLYPDGHETLGQPVRVRLPLGERRSRLEGEHTLTVAVAEFYSVGTAYSL